MKAKKLSTSTILTYIVFPLLIVVAWFWAAQYTFNDKLDLNGDNFCYYIYSSALADGHNYASCAYWYEPIELDYDILRQALQCG